MIIFWLAASMFCGIVATSKERSFIGWTLIALLFSPLIAILALIVVPTKQPKLMPPAPAAAMVEKAAA